MKEWRYFWAFVLCCIMTGVQAQTNTNILRVPDITYPAGKTLSLPVELNNSNDIVGVQFEIDVPYEINKTGDDFNVTLSKLRAANHEMSVRDMGSHWYNLEGVGGIYYRRYRIIIFNAENQKISGSQGELLNILEIRDVLDYLVNNRQPVFSNMRNIIGSWPVSYQRTAI